MATDIWPVWAKPNGTPDIYRVDYENPAFMEELEAADGTYPDRVILVEEDTLLRLKEQHKDDTEIVRVIENWLATMNESGQPFVRLVINS